MVNTVSAPPANANRQIKIPDTGVLVRLTGEELVRVLQALGKGSFEIAAPIIENIQRQVIAQQVFDPAPEGPDMPADVQAAV